MGGKNVIRLNHINETLAGELLDFSGGDQSMSELAEQQLQGSVAIYNLL
jgi:hypothetical protein